MSNIKEDALPESVMQGYVIWTNTTRTFSKKEWDRMEAAEKLIIFKDFYEMDNGKSRKRIAECHNPKEAAELVRRYNAFPEMLQALNEVNDVLEEQLTEDAKENLDIIEVRVKLQAIINRINSK